MSLPFALDNQQHRMADALKELLDQSAGKPLDIATAYFAISGYRQESSASGDRYGWLHLKFTEGRLHDLIAQR